MKRSEAGRLIRSRPELTTAEFAVMMALLDRANNDDCVVPVKFAPSLRTLASEAHVHYATVNRALLHLERHGWLVRYRDELSGRGHRNGYGLLPAKPEPCLCPKKRSRGATHKTKKRSRGATTNGRVVRPETVASTPAFPQVRDGFALRGQEGGQMRDSTNEPPEGWPPGETGLCARCRQDCHRYGNGGGPLCARCKG